jgi:hypothetical protein
MIPTYKRLKKAHESAMSLYPESNESFLRMAAIRGDLGEVSRLVALGTNMSDGKALRYAILYGHLEVVRFILTCGVDVDEEARRKARIAARIAMRRTTQELEISALLDTI